MYKKIKRALAILLITACVQGPTIPVALAGPTVPASPIVSPTSPRQPTAPPAPHPMAGTDILGWPLANKPASFLDGIRSDFGFRNVSNGTKYHFAIDLDASKGTDVLAVADGDVTFAGCNDPIRAVVVSHPSLGIASVYYHLSKTSVKVGDHVNKGDKVGESGPDDTSVFGYHLDFRVVSGTLPAGWSGSSCPVGAASQYHNPTQYFASLDTGAADVDPANFKVRDGTSGGYKAPDFKTDQGGDKYVEIDENDIWVALKVENNDKDTDDVVAKLRLNGGGEVELHHFDYYSGDSHTNTTMPVRLGAAANTATDEGYVNAGNLGPGNPTQDTFYVKVAKSQVPTDDKIHKVTFVIRDAFGNISDLDRASLPVKRKGTYRVDVKPDQPKYTCCTSPTFTVEIRNPQSGNLVDIDDQKEAISAKFMGNDATLSKTGVGTYRATTSELMRDTGSYVLTVQIKKKSNGKSLGTGQGAATAERPPQEYYTDACGNLRPKKWNPQTCQYETPPSNNPCQPDDTAAIGGPGGSGSPAPSPNASPRPSSIADLQGATVAVLQGAFSDSLTRLLTQAGVQVEVIPADFSPTIAQQYPALFIPSGALSGYAGSDLMAERLARYTEAGGTLVVFSQPQGRDFALLPGGQVAGYGYDEDIHCVFRSVGISEFGAPLISQTEEILSINVDGYFTHTPPDATILLRRTVTGAPAMFTYAYGSGRVLVSSSYADMASDLGQGSAQERLLIRDLAAWSLGGDANPPQTQPGGSANLTLRLANPAPVAATSAIFDVIGPDGSYGADEQPVNIPAGGSITLPLTQAVPAYYEGGDTPSAGLWRIQVTLFDADGNQLALIPAAATFGVTNRTGTPGGFRYSGEPYAITVTSEGTEYLPHSDVHFTFHVFNYDTQARTFHVTWGLPHHGLGWDQTLSHDVTVAPGSVQDFDYTLHGVHDLDRLRTILWLDGRRVAYGERGFWMVQPRVDVSLRPDRPAYAVNETPSLTVSARSLMQQSLPLAGTLQVQDHAGNQVASLPVQIDLPAGQQQSLSLNLPGPLPYGVYQATLRLGVGNAPVYSTTTTIFVPLPDLRLSADRATNLDDATPFTLHVANAGSVTALGVTVSAMLSNPAGQVIWQDRQDLNLGAAGSLDHSLLLPAVHDLGDYRLHAEAAAGGRTLTSYDQTLPADLRLSVNLDSSTYRVRDTAQATVTVQNTGVWRLAVPLSVSVPDNGFAPAPVPLDLAGGAQQRTNFAVLLNPTLAAGSHDFVAQSHVGARDLSAHAPITITPSRVEDRLGVTTVHGGDTLDLRLVNPGGVDTAAPYSARLLDHSGNVLAQVTGTAALTAGDAAGQAIALAVPNGAADGPYKLIVDGQDQASNAPFAYRHDLTVDGLRGQITIATDQPAYLDHQAITLSGQATATHGAIDGGAIQLDVYGMDASGGGNECAPAAAAIPTVAAANRLLALHTAPTNPQKERLNKTQGPLAPRLGILASHWVGDGPPVPNPWDNGNYTEQLYNQILSVAVAQGSGRITVGTTLGDPNTSTDDYQRLLYGHASPWSSYTTVKLNGQNLLLDSLTMVEPPHYDAAQQAIVTTFANPGSLRIQQVVTLVRSGSGRPDVAKVAYHVANTGNQPQDVGLRIMYDTQLGYNDGAPFRILGYGAITQETEFLGHDVPSRFLAVDSLSQPQIVAQGILTAAGERTPDRLVFANWSNLYNHAWEYTVNPNGSVTGDSAVAYYWTPTTLAPGQAMDVATRYGSSDVSFGSGEISTVVNAPAELRSAADNPFTVWAFVRNNTYTLAHQVQSTIALPSGLELAAGQGATQTIGDLAAGADAQASWVVRATGQPTGRLAYSVSTTAGNVSGSTANQSICVHAAAFATERGLHVWSSRLAATTTGTLPYSAVVPGLAPGKYYAVATLQAPTGQELGSASVPFYVTADQTLLTLQTDRSVYRVGDTVTVSGQVTNGSTAAGAFDLALQSGSTTILTDHFNLAPGESHPFTAQVTASAEGVLVLQATANSAHASERVRVATPQVTYSVSAPQVVGHAPFGVDVQLANTGLLPAQVTVSVDGQPRSFTLDPGAQTLDHRELHLMGDGSVTVLLSGDASATQTLAIHMGESARMTVAPADAYLEGPVTIPYTLTNTGDLPTTLTAHLSVDGQTVERSVSLSPGATAADSALFQLTPGDHILTYQTELGQGQATLHVRPAQPTVALTGALPDTAGAFTLHLQNPGDAPLAGRVHIYTPWNEENLDFTLALGGATDLTGHLDTTGAPAPGTYPLNVDVVAGGTVLAHLGGSFTLHGPRLDLQVDPPAAAAGADATFTARVTNGGDIDADGPVTLDLPSITQQTQHIHLRPGESTTLTFTANMNPDLPTGPLNGTLQAGDFRLPFQYQVTGFAGQATATLDARYYTPGQTAHLTLQTATQSPSGSGETVIARISDADGLNLEQSFPAGQSPTLTFVIPVGQGDQLLSYGLYLQSGRSLFIDTVRIPVATGSIMLYPDEATYRPGDQVHLTVQARHAGQLHLDGPGVSLDQAVPAGESHFAFTLPAPMLRGVYPLHYALDGEAHTYPIAVNAPAAQVQEIRVGGSGAYAPGDTLSTTLTLNATEALPDATIQWWLDGQDGSTNQWPRLLPPGPSHFTITQALAGLTQAGEHTLHVRINRGGLTLAEGAALFTIRGGVVMGVAPAGTYWETQPVQVDVALRGNGTGHLSLLVDGQAARDQDVALSGYQTVRLALGALAAGRHTLTAHLAAGGLSSEVRGAVTVLPLPQVTIGISGSTTADWYNRDPQITLTPSAADAPIYFRWDDGPSTLWYGQSLRAPSDGEHTLSAWALGGGSAGPVVTRTIRIDRTPPTLAIDLPIAADYPHYMQLQPTVEVTDATSGIAGTRMLVDGQTLPGLPDTLDLFYLSPGSHTFRVEATDVAGNTTVQQVTFRVTSDLPTTVKDALRARDLGWMDDSALSDVLTDLTAVQSALDDGQNQTAIALLQAFIQHVGAQRGQHINAQAADLLEADARWVIGTLQ